MKIRQVSILSGIALATSGMVFGLSLPSSALTWNWSYSGGGTIGGSGTFTTTDGPTEPFLITGITGTAEGNTITTLLPLGAFSNDNLLNTSQPQLTGNGVSWKIDNEIGNLFVNRFNLFSDVNVNGSGGGYLLKGESEDFSEPPVVVLVTFSATPSLIEPAVVPEPSLLLSFITLGGLMLGGAVRRVRQ
jgi:hypothetical protein